MRLRKKFLQIPKVSKDYKPKISSSALAEVKENFEAYCSLILQSDLSPNSQSIYIESGDKFVRWLSGRFMPRSRKERVYALRNRSRPEAFPAPYFVDTGMFPATAAFLAGYEVYYRRRNWLFGSEYWFQKVSSPSTRNPLFNGGEFVATWVILERRALITRLGDSLEQFDPKGPYLVEGRALGNSYLEIRTSTWTAERSPEAGLADSRSSLTGISPTTCAWSSTMVTGT